MIRPTSAWANRSRSTMTSRKQCERIVNRLAKHGPLTSERLETVTGIPGNSLRSAVIDCMRARTVRVVQKRYGKTRAGNEAELLTVKP